MLVAVVELAYRPELWYATDKEYLFLSLPLPAFNGFLHYRLRRDRAVTWRWLLFLSAVDIALITAAVIIGGEFHLFSYVAYYPALALFAVVFPHLWLSLAWATTPSQRSDLIEISRRGKPLARTVKRALALLKADEGLSDREAAEAVSVSALTVARARRRFVDEGLEAAINDRPRPGRERKLSGRQEAHLVAIACSSPPEGHVSWTLHLLADKVVELEFAGSISLETVRQILKKTNSSRGRRKSGASPR